MPVTQGTRKLAPYGRCVRLSNDTVELLITRDMGPRIIAYRFIGGENILSEMPLEKKVSTALGDWHPMGGHRLWHAPEAMPRSYYPDNSPVKVEKIDEGTICVTPPPEAEIGIQKAMTISLAETGTAVRVTHEITNIGAWPVELAPWALTIMRTGGSVTIPQEPFIAHGEHFLPARPLVMWHYTDLSDPRLRLGKKYIRLSTDPKNAAPNKIGVADSLEWAAYHREGTLFVKRFPLYGLCEYPDMGCNCETYTEGDFIELESLGTLVMLEPGEAVEHVEAWFLFKGVDIGEDEESLDKAITPLIEETEE